MCSRKILQKNVSKNGIQQIRAINGCIGEHGLTDLISCGLNISVKMIINLYTGFMYIKNVAYIQGVSEIHGTHQKRVLCTETTKNISVNVVLWTLHFRAMAHLQRDAHRGVYVTILKALCMLRQLKMERNYNRR
jgi:hypothetical protein